MAGRIEELIQAVIDFTGGPGNERVRVDAVLEVGDLEIGAVEIKDHTSDDRAAVGTDKALKVNARPSGSIVAQGEKLVAQIHPDLLQQSPIRAADDPEKRVHVGRVKRNLRAHLLDASPARKISPLGPPR